MQAWQTEEFQIPFDGHLVPVWLGLPSGVLFERVVDRNLRTVWRSIQSTEFTICFSTALLIFCWSCDSP